MTTLSTGADGRRPKARHKSRGASLRAGGMVVMARGILPLCSARSGLTQLAQLRAKIPSRFVAALLPHQELGRPEPLALACSADCEGLTVCAETDSSPQVFAMHGSASISALRPTL